MVRAGGSDVEVVEESVEVGETESSVGWIESTGDRDTILAVFTSILFPGIGISDEFESTIEGMEVNNPKSVDFGSIMSLDVGDGEPTGDRATILITFCSFVGTDLVNMGLGVQMQALVSFGGALFDTGDRGFDPTGGSTGDLWLSFPFLEIGVVKIDSLLMDPSVWVSLFDVRSREDVTVGEVVELG